MNIPGTIKINFTGGIVSPGDLYNILVAAGNHGCSRVRFGLRQQLILESEAVVQPALQQELSTLGVISESNLDAYPNITSSFCAEEVFITRNWLSEGVYKDILQGFDFRPELKVNISDSNQSFTPLLTGNINWVASPATPHYWHCFIRFPKTNIIYEAGCCVYTNDLPRATACIESALLAGLRDGAAVFAIVRKQSFLLLEDPPALALPPFNLPYYEGLNRYNDKYWLGIYRREEWFSVAFLKALCLLCLRTRVGQFCITSWKSVIVKSIEEKDRPLWNELLAKHQLNMRHAANELNFQVEDHSTEALALKQFLVKRLNDTDCRTFGICFGIKTRPRSEVFSNILVRRKPWIRIGPWTMVYRYDICCSEDFNPNKRTAWVFSKNNPRWLLPEQLRRAVLAFYQWQLASIALPAPEKPKEKRKQPVWAQQCGECLSVYDGETEAGGLLPADAHCALCEAPHSSFNRVDLNSLS